MSTIHLPRAVTISNQIATNAASFAQANPANIGLSDHDTNSDMGKRVVSRYRKTPVPILELDNNLANFADIIDPFAKVARFLLQEIDGYVNFLLVAVIGTVRYDVWASGS